VANRLVSNGAVYNPRNQRVFDGTYIYLYTPEGKLAGKYQPDWSPNGSQAFIQGQPNVYFAGELIQEQGQWVMTDRLGSVRLNGNGARSSYQPYGAEVAPATNDQRTKFATYYRDSPGLDYAGQRYYGNAIGRFLTPDPGGQRTANPKSPTSWNGYAYAGGDPVNRRDPSGRFSVLLYAPPYNDIGDGWDFGDDEDGGGDGDPCFADEFGFGPNPACDLPVPVSSGVASTPGSPTVLSGCFNWGCMPAALAQALADLQKPDCAAVFAGGIAKGDDPAAVLQAIVAGTQYGSVLFENLGPGTGAQESAPLHAPWKKKTVKIEINSGTYPDGIYWNKGNAGVNALTLLHELGHAFNDLFGSGSSMIVNDTTRTGKIIQSAEDANANALKPCGQ
jgi:RHS repeat-associated protein